MQELANIICMKDVIYTQNLIMGVVSVWEAVFIWEHTVCPESRSVTLLVGFLKIRALLISIDIGAVYSWFSFEERLPADHDQRATSLQKNNPYHSLATSINFQHLIYTCTHVLL